MVKMMTVIGHILGFPRIGLYRELKYALEQYWNGIINQDKLFSIGHMLRMRHWQHQIDSGLDFISVGDFAWYDHVLTMSAMIDNIPFRHRSLEKQGMITMDMLFNVARGYSVDTDIILPSEMKKWFNTNYHYIVPEFVKNQQFKLNWMQLFTEIDEALSFKHAVKPILIGPVTYLWVGKIKGKEFDRLSLLPSLLLVYQEILDLLIEKGIDWVQIDEPALVLELPKEWIAAYFDTYKKLRNNKIKLLLTTYFDSVYHQIDVIKQLSVDGLHVDLVSSCCSVDILKFHRQLPEKWILSLGIINGRNIWKTNLNYWFDQLCVIKKKRTLWIGSSCSFLHIPIDLNAETQLNDNVKSWFAFALQKCSEIKMLCDVLNCNNENDFLNRDLFKQYYSTNATRVDSNLVNNFQVQERFKSVMMNDSSTYCRKAPYSVRVKLQHKKFCLPLYPTTTIGSFPQTKEIRNLRLKFKNDYIDVEQYNVGIKQYIKQVIEVQEKLGLDVLVHGEPERNDMVEYFGEHLHGFEFTQNGWVQSYGSRCVKPPVIVGDVDRSVSITKQWINYAQSLTKKPVKGILTGPITIMSWSFLREDIERYVIAMQIALAIRDEVLDLERSGVSIIQIDEPALKEGLPLKVSEQKDYLRWAIDAFRITVSSVRDDTQIHTHMCYSEFNEIIYDLLRLDADVVSIEASRSDIKLLESLHNKLDNLNEIGLGLYDIHSINIPTVNDFIKRLKQFLLYIPKERLWINPDCGLKTRSWIEIKKALNNMVVAAKMLREQQF